MAFDFSVNILPFCAAGQQSYEVDVIIQWTVRVHSFSFGLHHFQEGSKGGVIVVEHKNIFPDTCQLKT